MRLTMSIGFNKKYSQTVTHSIHKSHFPHKLSCKGYLIVLGKTEKVYCYLLQILKILIIPFVHRALTCPIFKSKMIFPTELTISLVHFDINVLQRPTNATKPSSPVFRALITALVFQYFV